MKVMILCGGRGTRLAGLTGDVPKPMVPVGGRPILWHIMKGLAHWSYRDFILCLGYRSDLITQYFQDPAATDNADERGWHTTLAETGLDSMTGFRVRLAAAHLGPEDDVFGVTYGDGVCDLDFRKVEAFHRAHGKLATVTAVHPPGRFGELQLGDRGSVLEFNEKPQVSAGWISGGFFVFSRAVLDYLPPDPTLMLEEEPLRRLARDGQLMAYAHEGFWQCVDTPRDLQQLSKWWSEGHAPWKVWRET